MVAPSNLAGTPVAIMSRTVTIPGPVGPLECIVDEQQDGAGRTGIAVVCHPHPQHQGTMHNKVVHTLSRFCARRGMVSVRFNYRGVGQSAGSFAGGDGETADALAVIEWAMGEYPDVPLHLAGFSFGAMVAIRAATQQMPAALITVAPAIRFFDAAFTRPSCPWLVIQGEADEIVSAAEVTNWARSLEPPPALITLSAVGHFFHGALGTIPEAAGDFLDSVPVHAPAQTAVT